MLKNLNTKEIKVLLHHREPYLLLDSIDFMSEHEVVANKLINRDDFFIQGHFPGAHILPGAMMQEMSTQAAGVLITKFYSPVKDYNSEHTKGYALGVLRKVNYARYKKFAKPNDKVKIHAILASRIENMFEFKATLSVNNQVLMKNSFQLVNIQDNLIRD